MTINQDEPELGLLRTEQVDAKFQLLDVMSISELLQAMNESDTGTCPNTQKTFCIFQALLTSSSGFLISSELLCLGMLNLVMSGA